MPVKAGIQKGCAGMINLFRLLVSGGRSVIPVCLRQAGKGRL